MTRVPLARRNLLAEPRRLAAGVAGIGLALMLILLLGGLWAGIQAQSGQYVDATGAALWVLPPDTRTLFAEGTQLPTSTLKVVRSHTRGGLGRARPRPVRHPRPARHQGRDHPGRLGTRPAGRGLGARPGPRSNRRRRGRDRPSPGRQAPPQLGGPPERGRPQLPGGRDHPPRRLHDRVRVRHPPRGRDPAPRPGQDQRDLGRHHRSDEGPGAAASPRPGRARHPDAAPLARGGQHQGVRLAAATDGGDCLSCRGADRGLDRLRRGGRAPPRVRDHQGPRRQSPPPGPAGARTDPGPGGARPGHRWAAAGRGASAVGLDPASIRGRHHRRPARPSGGGGAGNGAAGHHRPRSPPGPAGPGDAYRGA
jgi:hypothetical protein